MNAFREIMSNPNAVVVMYVAIIFVASICAYISIKYGFKYIVIFSILMVVTKFLFQIGLVAICVFIMSMLGVYFSIRDRFS